LPYIDRPRWFKSHFVNVDVGGGVAPGGMTLTSSESSHLQA
jgi:hypothetical protein